MIFILLLGFLFFLLVLDSVQTVNSTYGSDSILEGFLKGKVSSYVSSCPKAL